MLLPRAKLGYAQAAVLLVRVVVGGTGFNGVHDTLHRSVLTLERTILGYLGVPPWHVTQRENRADLRSGTSGRQ